MDPSVQNQIVNILVTDVVLISNWKKLIGGLELEAGDFVMLEKQVKNNTIETNDLFSRILSKWSSAKGREATIDILRQILEDNGFRAVAEKLENKIRLANRRKTDQPIWFEIPRATSNFVGRRKKLEQLKELYKSQKSLLVVTTTGMGGVGKSELVKNFAKQIAATESASCIWLNGETKETLKNSLTRFTSVVKPSKLDLKDPIEVQFCQAILTIKDQPRILMIVDNVDEANEDVQKLISKIPEDRCFFLVTSRNVGVLEYAGIIIKLDILSDEAAINLLNESDIDEPDDEIIKLCTLLGNFPLALQQAVAYIKKEKHTGVKGESYKISDYIATYEKQQPKLLDYKLNLIEHDYKETTLITWNISFEKIKKDEQFGKLAIQLLNTIAYFEPDGIHVEFLSIYQKDLLDAVPLITTYSLVEVEYGIIFIHRLLQEVIRLNLISDELEIPQLTKSILTIKPLLETAERYVGLRGVLNWTDFREGRLKQIGIGMSHIVSALKYAAKHPQLLFKFKNIFLHTVNNLKYFQRGREITDLSHVTLDQLNITFNVNTEFKLRLESELAYFKCRVADNIDKDRYILEMKNVYAKQLSILGEEDESTMTTAHCIAAIQYNYSRKFSDNVQEENLQWCRKAVDLKSKVLGPLHKSTLSTKLLLADHLYDVSRNYNEAVNLYEECCKWQVTHFGADRRDTEEIREKYIKCLLKKDRYEETRFVLEQYLQESTLNQSKSYVYDDLSTVLFCLGKTDEAFSALRHAVSLCSFVTINHYNKIPRFDSSLSKNKDADILLSDGKFSEALEIYKYLRNFNIRTFDLKSFWWEADVEYKISLCLIGQQKFKEAQEALQKALEMQLCLGGDKSKPVIETKTLLNDVNRKIETLKDPTS